MPIASEAMVSQKASAGRQSARRQQAIDVAAATFARLGYHGASTRTIADALGIKVASLYFHIASKEEALAEICLLGMARPLIYLAEALREDTTLAAQIRHFFQRQREDLIAHADYVTVSIREWQHLGDSAKTRIRELTARFRRELDTMFERADERGELRPGLSPREGRFIVIGTLRGISEMYLSGPIRNADDVIMAWTETMIRGIVAHYMPPEEATKVASPSPALKC